MTSADYYDYADRRVDGTAVSAPRVTGVAFTQAPSSGGWYGAGETIGVRVSFDKELAVAGEPRLALDVGGETRHATLREAGGVVDSPRVAEDGIGWTFRTSTSPRSSTTSCSPATWTRTGSAFRPMP